MAHAALQTPDHVVVLNEMVHDSRIIPLDGGPRPGIESWTDGSRGQWEGHTLVIETVDFSDKHGCRGSTKGRHLVERFTCVDADTLLYEFTISDPATWTAPWTARVPDAGDGAPALRVHLPRGQLRHAQHPGRRAPGGAAAGERAGRRASTTIVRPL